MYTKHKNICWLLLPFNAHEITYAPGLVGRYPLHSSRVAGKLYNHPCQLCLTPDETVEHFLLHCPALEEDRKQTIEAICNTVNDASITNDIENLTKLF